MARGLLDGRGMLFHVTLASEGRFQAFTDEERLRLAVRTLARIAGPKLVSWALPGNHLHGIAVGTRAEVGFLCRDVRFGLRAIGVRLEEAHRRPITDVKDLENVVAYHLRQARRHGSSDRPALYGGACFLDYAGARVVPGFDPALLLRHLPRFELARHLQEVAARTIPMPVPEPDVRQLGAARLIEATASALCVGPDLSGNEPAFATARRVAVGLGTAAGISRKELAFALDLASWSVCRLERPPRDPRLELAVRRRLAVDAIALVVEPKPRSDTR